MKIIRLTFLLGILSLVFIPFYAADASLVNDLSGQILLQVEQNGEAWYVNPDTKKLHFMGRPIDAL